MAWYTWGHWGDFQVDCGREIYVPASILQGKMLYRDIWYMYGPLAPYFQALLFLIFGIHLNVLYLFGLALTIGSALLIFEISRQFDLGLPACIVSSIFFLSEAFYPFIFNFVFPYSYAASLGSFLGLTCLYFMIRHASGMRRMHLGLAALFAALALLTKQEIGFACSVLLAVEVAASYLIHRSPRELGQNLVVCSAGLSPALTGYGWFTWKLSAKLIYFENWISTPGTYFMRTFGKHMMASQGFRLVAAELVFIYIMTLLAMACWYVIAYANTFAIKKLRVQPRLCMVIWVLVGSLVVMVFRIFGTLDILRTLVSQIIVPKGMYLLGLFFVAQTTWRLWKVRKPGLELSGVVLGIYALLVSVRVMMELVPSPYNYAVYFNVPLFLVFIIIVTRVIHRASRSLDAMRQNRLITSMLSVEAGLLLIVLLPNPQQLPAPLVTAFGTFYTRPDVAILFPQIISFMKTHTKNGKDILVVPEAPSLYVFAGMQAPSRWYTLLPGIVAPDQEEEFIKEVASNQVRYVLISNREVPEYGVAPFGIGYNQSIYQWILANYVKVGQIGPVDNSRGFYKMSIFEIKDANTAP